MFEKVAAIIRDCVEDKDIEITMDSDLVDDMGLSSLDVINIIAESEDEFGIDIPDRVISNMHTVRDIVEFLEKTV